LNQAHGLIIANLLLSELGLDTHFVEPLQARYEMGGNK